MDLLTISAAEFQRNFGRYQDEALKQPVAVTRNGRDRLVVLSVEEYKRLIRRDRQVLAVRELSADQLATIAASDMDPRLEHLNEELG